MLQLFAELRGGPDVHLLGGLAGGLVGDDGGVLHVFQIDFATRRRQKQELELTLKILIIKMHRV